MVKYHDFVLIVNTQKLVSLKPLLEFFVGTSSPDIHSVGASVSFSNKTFQDVYTKVPSVFVTFVFMG